MKLTYNLLFSLAVGSLAAPHATTTAPQKIRAIWSYAKDDSTTSLKISASSSVLNSVTDPRTNFLQEVISCGSAASFSVGYLESESFTIGFSTSGNPVTIVSDPVIVKSPNSDNRGGGYYCVIGTCRAKGDNYWDNTGPAGGPQ
ncbi:hypothetical protein AUP68_07030 [Ilyonectria robusta]